MSTTRPPTGRKPNSDNGPGVKKKYKLPTGSVKGYAGTFREGTPLPLGKGQGLDFGLPFDPTTRGMKGIERGAIVVSNCTVMETKTCWGDSISSPCQILHDPGIYESNERTCVQIAMSGPLFKNLLRYVKRAGRSSGEISWPHMIHRSTDSGIDKVILEAKLSSKIQPIVYVPDERKRLYQHQLQEVFDTYRSDLHGTATMTIFLVRSAKHPENPWRLKLGLRFFEVIPTEEQLSWDRGDSETLTICNSDISSEADFEGHIEESGYLIL